jgi:glutathione synthase/RimK-type ligase-like ATP-grasp enzyme
MQQYIQAHSLSVATTYMFTSENNHESLTSDKFNALKTLSDESFPVAVLKTQSGTHGNGIRFFYASEIEEAKSAIETMLNEGKNCILQSYIRPMLSKPTVMASAHYRIIMMRDEHSKYHFNGAIHFEREGTFISNSHHNMGELSKKPVLKDAIPEAVLESLALVAERIGANQFGADVIHGEDGQYYVLELNDCMGISGAILEQQQVAQKYAKSFSDRLKAQTYRNTQTNENTNTCFSFFRNIGRQVCTMSNNFMTIRNQP